MEKLALLAGGSFKTVHDRLRIAGRLSQHLHKLNIQIQDLQHLKSSHIESYVMARREAGITPRTLQNEMAALRTIWICPYISRHLLSLNPLLARCRRYSRGER
ncbi:phage integrase N-terminal domain-containing protein [Klebsiella pneumoniae]|nr:phage integrase N-terminal domain-containing protein [Klebsiella pneumoniae]UHL86372.1 site-specific integrase [Klebsiella pneumoniae]WJT99308.1 phage integrase N-terminal domain-containing protein [Klebsiella pneumoniae]